MSDERKFTPTPWAVVEATEHHGPYIVSEWGTTVADLYAMSNPNAASVRNGGDSYPIPFGGPDEAGANADLIVRAVNGHEALVEALTNINRNLCETRTMAAYEVGKRIEWCIDEARRALSQAGAA